MECDTVAGAGSAVRWCNNGYIAQLNKLFINRRYTRCENPVIICQKYMHTFIIVIVYAGCVNFIADIV